MESSKNDQKTACRWYCVVEIRSGRIAYLGKYISLAAVALEPGTCWATAFGPDLAECLALEEAVRFTRIFPPQIAA